MRNLLLFLALVFIYPAANANLNQSYWDYIDTQLTQIANEYTEDPRFYSLAVDPDHAYKMSLRSFLESLSGLHAEKIGIITPPIKRGPKGTEFIDGDEAPWDVKTPVSPRASDTWSFSSEKVILSIIKKLNSDDRIFILLDMTYLKEKDSRRLEESLYDIDLNLQDRIKIIHISNPFEVNKKSPL